MWFEQVEHLMHARCAERPLVLLRHLRWDDNSYRITFHASLRTEDTETDLGQIKIVRRDGEAVAKLTRLPSSPFERLDERYLSHFLDDQVEARVGDLAPSLFGALRAAPGPDAPEGWPAEALACSLFRFVPSSDARQLQVEAVLEGFATAHNLRIAFGEKLTCCAALVGNNGTGKTRLLAKVAHLCAYTGRPRHFRGVIALSFTPFDAFPRPSFEGNLQDPVLHYAGLRNELGEVDLPWAFARARDELARMSAERRADWVYTWSRLGLSKREGVFAKLNDPGNAERLFEALPRAAAGHQVLVLTMIHLVARVSRAWLVLFDEPEAHLHPGLLSSLIRETHRLVQERGASLLVATHSAVVLQEIPASMIRVLTVEDGVPACRPLPVESFGQDLGSLHDLAFHQSWQDRNWRTLLDDLVDGKRGAAALDAARAVLQEPLPLPVLAALRARA